MSDCISLYDLSWQTKLSEDCSEENTIIKHRTLITVPWKRIPDIVYQSLQNRAVQTNRTVNPSTFFDNPVRVTLWSGESIEEYAPSTASCDGHVMWVNPKKQPRDWRSDSGYDSNNSSQSANEYCFILMKLDENAHMLTGNNQAATSNAQVPAENTQVAADNAQAPAEYAQVQADNTRVTGGDESETMAKVPHGVLFATIWPDLWRKAEAIMGHGNFIISTGGETSISSLLVSRVTKNYQFIVTPKND